MHTTQTKQVGMFPCRGLVAPCQRAPGSITALPRRCQRLEAGAVSLEAAFSRTGRPSVRAAEFVIEVRLDAIPGDRLQKIPDGGQVLLPKHGKLVNHLRGPADIRKILLAAWKGEPIVARKGDACSCRGGSSVALERKVRSSRVGRDRGGKAQDK